MLLRWVGGKSLLADEIISIFPSHKRYIEPFFGGGWVFFKKQPADHSIINDINSDLINLYQVVRDQPQELARLVAYTPKSDEVFKQYMLVYNTDYWTKIDPVKRAMIYFFMIKNSFNGLMKSFSVGSTGWASNGMMETIAKVSDRLKSTDILNRDWMDVVAQYANKDTLVYLDPPYALTVDEKDYYYEYVMTKKQHEDMRNFLVNPLLEFKFVVSYDIHPLVEELYGGVKGIRLYKTSEVFQSSINKSSKAGLNESQDRSSAFKQEYLITNYDINLSLPLFT